MTKKQEEQLAEIRTSTDGSLDALIKDFMLQHFGAIDKDIELRPVYSGSRHSRTTCLQGIQLSTGDYGHKTIRRAMVKNKQISLTKLGATISELAQIANDKKARERESHLYEERLGKAKRQFMSKVHKVGFIQSEKWSSRPQNGVVELEFRHLSLRDDRLRGCINIEINTELADEQLLKVAEYLKDINSLLKNKGVRKGQKCQTEK